MEGKKDGLWSSLVKHGHCQNYKVSSTHRIWSAMKSRCQDKNCIGYPSYGARGITVCERWQSFTAFLEDMGPRPAGRSLDRINGKLGYFKENCRWATRKEQSSNQRRNILMRINNEVMTVSEACRRYGVDRKWMAYRVKRKGIQGPQNTKAQIALFKEYLAHKKGISLEIEPGLTGEE